MKFPTFNFFISVLLIAGIVSCGQQSKNQEDSSSHTEAHDHSHGHSHDHEHGHSHKAGNAALMDGSYKVDVEKSFVKWTGKKITGSSHYGKLKLTEGSVDIKDNSITSNSKFTLDMSTITVEDIPVDDKMNGKLKGHLENPDFFNVSEFPHVTFKVSKISNGEKEGMINVTGDLTIKGITNSITFPAHIMNHDGTLHAMADIVFDRTKYNIKYKSSSFFSDLGDKAIVDNVELELHLYANM